MGKVTDDNLQVLKRMGITLPDVANEADVLAAVQAKFAGKSKTYAESTAGQFEAAKIQMGELKEQLGTALLPAMTAIAKVLVSDIIPAFKAMAAVAGPVLKAAFGWIADNKEIVIGGIAGVAAAILTVMVPAIVACTVAEAAKATGGNAGLPLSWRRNSRPERACTGG